MKNYLTRPMKLNLMCGGEAVCLTVAPLTYLRMIDIDISLGDKDLTQVLQNPTILDLTVVAYCMLTESSKSIINKIDVEISSNDKGVVESINKKIGDDSGDINPVHKLFYMMCESNISDGTMNYATVLNVISSQIESSLLKEPITKKKTLASRLRLV